MDILIVQVFVSLLLVAGGVLALAYSVKQADHEHADRLSLLPLIDEPRPAAGAATDPSTLEARNDGGAKTDHV